MRGHGGKRWTVLLLLIFPIFYAGVSQVLGQDVDFDLQNYHYFDSYWLLVDHMRDVTPAQLQTYLSPVLDIPFYFATRHFPPRLTGSLLAVIQGISFPLIYLISRHFTEKRWVALLLAGLGMFTAGALSEVGAIMGDTLVAPLFFAAILLGLRSLDQTRANFSKLVRDNPSILIATACGLAGVAAGLKLSGLPVALGIALAFPLVSGTLAQRFHKAISACGGLVIGIFFSYGWWGYELTHRYGNPILPYLNQIFHSAYAPTGYNPYLGTKPQGIVDSVFYPIVWTLHPDLVGGVSFLEASVPIAELLLLTVLAISVIKSVFQRRYVKAFDNDKQRYLIVLAVVAYVAWVSQFGYYRYFVPIEMLSFILIFVCLQSISTQIGWKPLARFGTIVIALVCVISETPMNWGRAAWASSYFSVSIPKSLRNQSAAFLMLGTNPDAFVVPSFPKQDFFAQINGNLPPTPYLRKKIVNDVSTYRYRYTIWEDPVLQTSSLFSYSAQASIETYGYQIDWSACSRFPATVGSLSEELNVCRLKKAPKSSLPPLTIVLAPTAGDQLRGRQYLVASAFAAVGLDRVGFSIAGEGRTVTSRAAITPYGWLGGWNTRSVPNGVYTVRSVAYGANGLTTLSTGVVVDVKN